MTKVIKFPTILYQEDPVTIPLKLLGTLTVIAESCVENGWYEVKEDLDIILSAIEQSDKAVEQLRSEIEKGEK